MQTQREKFLVETNLELLLSAGQLVPQPGVLLAESLHLRPQLLLLGLHGLEVTGQGGHHVGLAQPKLYHLQGPLDQVAFLLDEAVLGAEVGALQGGLDPPENTLVLLSQGFQAFSDCFGIGDYFIL